MKIAALLAVVFTAHHVGAQKIAAFRPHATNSTSAAVTTTANSSITHEHGGGKTELSGSTFTTDSTTASIKLSSRKQSTSTSTSSQKSTAKPSISSDIVTETAVSSTLLTNTTFAASKTRSPESQETQLSLTTTSLEGSSSAVNTTTLATPGVADPKTLSVPIHSLGSQMADDTVASSNSSNPTTHVQSHTSKTIPRSGIGFASDISLSNSSSIPGSSTDIIQVTLSEISALPAESTGVSTPPVSQEESASDSATPNPGGSRTTTGPISTTVVATSTVSSDSSEARVSSSTVTSVPDILTSQIGSLTGDTWVTESSSIIPVIGGIGVWNLPPVSSVMFELPGIPAFSLPCVSGNCGSPPRKVGGGGNGGGNEGGGKGHGGTGGGGNGNNNDDDQKPKTKDEDEPPTETPTSTTKSESSTTSSSSCSGGTTTASDCRAACSAFPTTVNNSVQSTTVCYTTTCLQTIGCSIEPTTSTSITTSTPQACALSTPYKRDLAATYRSLGLEIPLWLAYPITPLRNSEPRTSDTVSTSTATSDSTSASTTKPSSSRSTSTTTSSTSADSSESSRTTSTTSLSSSSTSQSPTFPSDPAPSCYDENDYNGHAPVDSAFVDEAAGLFCASVSDTEMTSVSEKFSKDYQANSNVNYLFEVSWIPDCEYTSDSQSITTPIGGALSCEDLMKETFHGCNNGGVGGSIEAGCLSYSFTGGLGDDSVPTPEFIPGDNNDEESDDPAEVTEEQPEKPVDDSTALVEGQQTCFDTGDFSHQDIKWSLVKGFSQNFCAEAAGSMENRNMTTNTESFGFFADGGVHFHLEWREGCEASTDSISVEHPMGDDGRSCSELLKKVWKDCNNNEGVGGSVDVGCLSYAVIGGRALYESLYGKL